jgi:uncharacterized membrane-anchored protein
MTRRTWFIIGLLLQLIFIFGLLAPNASLLANGTKATLRSMPVDPRSIFRGDYVTLDYEAGRGLPLDLADGAPVYVVLAQQGDVFERVSFSRTRPELQEGQICLEGFVQFGTQALFPDLRQFFVEEGTGMELEQARNAHRLLVDIVSDSRCRARIAGLRLGQEVSQEELDAWQQQMWGVPPEMPPAEKPVPAPVQ